MSDSALSLTGELTGTLSSTQELTGTLSSTEELTGTLDGPLVRGYSAYEIAVQEGYEGTVESWLLSLVGAQGGTGPQGIQGIQGEKGDTGDPGPKGDKGDTGDTGPQGPQGVKGDKGDKGDTGATGPKGDKGDTGDAGPQGVQGEKGETGATGAQGIQGPKGDTGAAGVDGYSPTATVTKTGNRSTISITDKNGTTTAEVDTGISGRVSSLTNTDLETGSIIEAIGIPEYVSDVTGYSSYGITDTGWYIFARICAGDDATKVTAGTTITGAAGYIATIGAGYVDVAVRFEVASVSKVVTVNWGDYSDSFVFKATDLAIRNLDYRTTFYVYDIDDYTTWTYALTSDETFVDGKAYYTEQDGEYTLAEVTAGDTITANTYYNHSKVTFSGMTRNISYRCNELIDCPIEIVLPVIPDDGYGAWLEIQMQYKETYSTTLIKQDEDVVIGTTTTQAQTAGMNTVDLHYVCANGTKLWTLINTHTNIPA